MADFTNPEILAAYVARLSDPNTVKQAEAELKPFMKQPASVIPMLQLLVQHPAEDIRMQVSLLLHKQMNSHLKSFDPAQLGFIRQTLLTRYVEETHKPTVRTLSVCIVDAQSSKKPWPELIGALGQIQDPVRSCLLIENLANSSSILDNCLADVDRLLQTAMSSTDAEIVSCALSALEAVLGQSMGEEDEDEEQAPRDMTKVVSLSGSMQGLLKFFVDNFKPGGIDETLGHTCLSVLQVMMRVELGFVNEYLQTITERCIAALLYKGSDDFAEFKSAATQLMVETLRFRPKAFTSANLVAPTLQAILSALAAIDPETSGSIFSLNETNYEEEESDDGDDQEEIRLPQVLLDSMALHLPSKYFAGPALDFIFNGIQSPDANIRKAGYAALGIISEGCCDVIKERLSVILPVVLTGCTDAAYFVRECACFSLGQFSEYCQPDVSHYHAQVLPVLANMLGDSHTHVRNSTCYSIEYYVESLQKETLKPYLGEFMSRIDTLLKNSGTPAEQELALGALAAVAVCSESDFIPYADSVIQFLSPVMITNEKKMFGVRGRSLECLGHIAVAIGRDAFMPYFESGLSIAVEGAKLNDDSLKEHCFVFIANCAKVMNKDMLPLLPNIVPYLVEVVEESELVRVGDEDEEVPEDDDEDDLDNYHVQFASGLINTKKAAITALGALAEATLDGFAPYLNNVTEALLAEGIGSVYSFHDTVRAESTLVTEFLVKAACSALQYNWTRTSPAPPADVASLATRAVVSALEIIKTDSEKVVVAAGCDALCGILRLVGPSVLAAPVTIGKKTFAGGDLLMKQLVVLMKGKANCQKEEEVDEDADHDNTLMDSVTNVIAVLAAVLDTPTFLTHFAELHKQLMKFTKSSSSHSDKSMALGCYAEVFGEIGAESAIFLNDVYPVIMSALKDPMESVRRNAVFCLGVVAEKLGEGILPELGNILTALYPLCIRSADKKLADSGGADVDNALSAVARMIIALPNHMPIEQVLPVILQNLPLVNDLVEGPAVYGSLLFLLERENVVAMQNIQAIISAIGLMFSTGISTTTETLEVCSRALKFFVGHATFGPVFQAYVASLTDAQHREVLQTAVSR